MPPLSTVKIVFSGAQKLEGLCAYAKTVKKHSPHIHFNEPGQGPYWGRGHMTTHFSKACLCPHYCHSFRLISSLNLSEQCILTVRMPKSR